MTSRADILLHPVRLRIVLAMGNERLTTTAIGRRMPDVAPATLYRQVGTLARAGILEVVDERRVRGSLERTYALVVDAARIGPEDAGEMTRDEHLRGFTTFTASLIDALGRYLDHPDADPTSDAIGYRQVALWLDADEREALIEELGAVLARYRPGEPTSERTRLLLSTILIPDLMSSGNAGAAEPEVGSDPG